ncbi:MAG TPA: hypothetical protein PKX07_14340 [Aggregatilineales bacterium]|jgi:hypothetical protein|nr:hypothetical protein [Aggregatilineales bacterium]
MASDTERDEIRRKATGAVLRNAVFSWQVAITLVMTAILYFFVPIDLPFWQQWFWLIAGGLAAAGFVGATLTDPEAAQDAVARQFASKYDMSKIKSRVSRKHLEDALEYRSNMLTLAKRSGGALRVSLTQTIDDIDEWIGHMYDLAEHIDSFDENELVKRDREQVPEMIRKTTQRLQREQDETVRRDLERQLAQYEQQQANLDAAFNGARRAEIQLQSTLSSLGTIYAQMSRLGTAEVDSGRAQRLRLEIQEEVAGLQDTIEAMEEVQSQSRYMTR